MSVGQAHRELLRYYFSKAATASSYRITNYIRVI
jgi:hypothetical protein